MDFSKMVYRFEDKNNEVLLGKGDLEDALLYKTILEGRKHNVHISIDGRDCLKKYEQKYFGDKPVLYTDCFHSNLDTGHTFGVVVLDACLPNRDGIQVAEKINEICPQQRILLLVSDTNKEAISKLCSKSNIDVIEKPIEPDILASKIERMLIARQIN